MLMLSTPCSSLYFFPLLISLFFLSQIYFFSTLSKQAVMKFYSFSLPTGVTSGCTRKLQHYHVTNLTRYDSRSTGKQVQSKHTIFPENKNEFSLSASITLAKQVSNLSSIFRVPCLNQQENSGHAK